MTDIVFDWIIYQRLPITIVLGIIALLFFIHAFNKSPVEGGHAFIIATLLALLVTLIWLPAA